MDGSDLVLQIRRALRDVTSARSQGQFYDDDEIILALNNAQMLFVNYCLERNLYVYLEGLIRVSNRIGWDTQLNVPANLNILTAPYLHIISAVFQDSELSYLSRVYLGGEALQYLYTEHYGTYIINNAIYFSRGWGGAPSNYNQQLSGRIIYYTYPARIYGALPSPPVPIDYVTKSFSDAIYENVILYIAASILSLKDSLSQRDVKLLSEGKTFESTIPTQLIYLYSKIDSFLEPYKPQ
ncbi:MAG: hypothetical protein BWY47_00033 [Bacteroidetes bacterium ADurb.Bin302]|nr:MAG: hypothetical protein BWY47_00033 [Bacteroidetes bacterium ADurb.Bin302]